MGAAAKTATPALTNVDVTVPALPSADYTTANEMKPVVIKIMQEAYVGGITQMTNGDIKKQLDRVKQSTGGWKDGDLEDVDPAPGIHVPLVAIKYPLPLREMRTAGDVTTDPGQLQDLHPVPVASASTACWARDQAAGR